VIVVVAAGIGWVYVMRQLHVLSLGPRLDGALPLQQLAGGDDQPLIRLIAAWLPAGVVAGVVLVRLARLTGALLASLAAAVSAAVLLADFAISSSIAQNDRVRQHVSAAFSQDSIWLAVALIALGVLIASPPRALRRVAAEVASRS
jgi:hypothetical protein